MKNLKSWIIIAGSGRNTGKTTLACSIIEANKIRDIVGIKISPHQHPVSGSDEVIVRSEDFCIIREKSRSTKDSSRMLIAGASEVFYVQCPDDKLHEAFTQLEKLTDGRPVVCESGGMRNIVKPSFFILVISEKHTNKPGLKDMIRLADMVTDLNEIRKRRNKSPFYLGNNEWKKAMDA